jgi:hypothetical protein
MAGRHLLAVILGLNLVAAASSALDLTQIDRSILKEPVYESKEPQYCLLVFGPEAKVHVWLVLDGDVLYVDRKGDGDLTDPDDRVSADHVWRQSKERPDIEVIRGFFVPVRGKRPAGTATELVLSCVSEVNWFFVEQFVPSDDFPNKAKLKMYRETPFRVAMAMTNEWEQDARVAFAARPEEAPILHFFGPQQVTLQLPEPLELRRGEFVGFLVGLTTRGVGSSVRTYQGIPCNARAVVDIEFPASPLGGASIRRRVELPQPGG